MGVGVAVAVGVGVARLRTLIDTVATFESLDPSFALYVKLSEPEKPVAGVYVTVAVSEFGVPSMQAWSVIGERLPFAGGVTIENVRSQVSRSRPLSTMSTGASSSVFTD